MFNVRELAECVGSLLSALWALLDLFNENRALGVARTDRFLFAQALGSNNDGCGVLTLSHVSVLLQLFTAVIWG